MEEDKGIEDRRFLIGSVSLSLLRLRMGCHIAQIYFFCKVKGETKREKSGRNVI